MKALVVAMKASLVFGAVGLALLESGETAASPELQAKIEAGCVNSLNWTESACACLAGETAILNDAQQGFLAASLNDEDDQASQYLQQLAPAEVMQASMFVINAGPGCQ